MKKYLLSLSACALAVAMVSCDGYDDKDYGKVFPYGPTQTAELTQGETINASKAYGYTGAWATQDDFVAKIAADGTVTAMHVGTTYMDALGQDNLFYKVVVKPTVEIFNAPVWGWNESVTEGNLKDTYGGDNLATVNVEETYTYEEDGETKEGKKTIAKYMGCKLTTGFGEEETVYAQYAIFYLEPVVDAKGKEKFVLVESAILVDATAADLIASQLNQFYENINSPETVPGLEVFNAYDVENASLGVLTLPYDTDFVMLRYFNPAAEASYIDDVNAAKVVTEVKKLDA